MKNERANSRATSRALRAALTIYVCLLCWVPAFGQEQSKTRTQTTTDPKTGEKQVITTTNSEDEDTIETKRMDPKGKLLGKEVKTISPSGVVIDDETYNDRGNVKSKRRTVTDSTGKQTYTSYEEYEGGVLRGGVITEIGPDGKNRIKVFNREKGVYEETTDEPAVPGLQDSPKPPVNYRPFEFYAGFSHNRVDAGDEREGFNGFATSLTGNFNRYVGLKGYYSYHTKSFEENGFDFSSSASIHQGFGGVQLKDNVLENGPVRPFAHFLAGVAHHRFNFDDGVDSFSDSRTGFAGVMGGGIDFRLNHRVDLRVQFDYNPNRIDDDWQHNVRAGFGVVFKFGGGSDGDDADDGTDDQDPSVSKVPQIPDAKKCEWNRYSLGKDTNVTQVRSDKPTVVEVRINNLAGSGGFEYHCLLSSGTALITYKYTDVNGAAQEGKLRVFCNP